MNRLYILLILVVAFASCDNNVWNELPQPIASFVSEYYPDSKVSSYGDTSNGGHYVQIHNGAYLTFDSKDRWLSVNGNGAVLPQVFLFDELPPSLYEYLQETENLDLVYMASRDNFKYELQLKSSRLTYTIDSGRITGEI